ncbi:TcfC E-set like domain-containing protein [Sphingomonas sp. R86521]|uniref:TcfC E-set like domain-containing protein n=1 Tax=Sphingomonas sp. R86521 TaxID=3093860 RepID=UPI0036D358D3
MVAASLTGLLSSTSHAVAKANNAAPRVTVGQPVGFDALLQPQLAVADIYVGGRAVGQARVRYLSGGLTFLDPDAVVALIPDLTDQVAVRAALAAPDLDTHARLACPADGGGDGGGDHSACGILQPVVAGIIFDERRFRIDLFVNPRLMVVHAAATREYLPAPDAGVSLVDQFGGTVAGAGGDADYGFSNRAILGLGAGRIRNDLSYSSAYGLSVDSLVGELDRPGLRYSAGALWVPGIDLIGRRRLVGAGVQSQVDTRLDRTMIAGTPLVVSLAIPARVDILRDGRLLTSRNYVAGNQTLDTSGLPDGAYEVVLHIQESGGNQRDERRFFTKNAAVAAIGEPVFFAYAGLLGEDRRGTPIAVTRTPFYQAGLAKRFTAHLALDATLIGTDKTAILELGGYWLTSAAQVRLAGLGSVRGDTGVLLQASSSGAARLNYSIDARRIWSRGDKPLIPLGYDRYPSAIAPIDRTAQLDTGSFAQLNGTISYDLKPGQIGLTGSYRRDRRTGRSYAIGPSVFWPLIARGDIQMSLRGDMTLSNQGKAASIGLSFQRLRSHTSVSATAGARSISGTGYNDGTAFVGGVAASWQHDHVLGGDAAVAGSVEREVEGTLVRGRADLRTAKAAVSVDVAQPIAGDNGATQYSFNFQTTAAVMRGHFALQGRDQNDSIIVVSVDGAAKGTPFEVLVDNAPRGTVHAGAQLSIAMPAYRRYTVRLRPAGTDIVRVDGDARQVSLYPGNVARVTWSAQRVVATFGRIVWPDGTAVANAAVYVTGAIGNTDENGYFQIEAGANAVAKVQAADGRTCRLPLAPTAGGADTNGYRALGTLVCPRAVSGTMMADAAR